MLHCSPSSFPSVCMALQPCILLPNLFWVLFLCTKFLAIRGRSNKHKQSERHVPSSRLILTSASSTAVTTSRDRAGQRLRCARNQPTAPGAKASEGKAPQCSAWGAKCLSCQSLYYLTTLPNLHSEVAGLFHVLSFVLNGG